MICRVMRRTLFEGQGPYDEQGVRVSLFGKGDIRESLSLEGLSGK